MSAGPSRHDEISKAMVRLYGSPCGADMNEVCLDDYDGMDPEEAAEAIVADARVRRIEREVKS